MLINKRRVGVLIILLSLFTVSINSQNRFYATIDTIRHDSLSYTVLNKKTISEEYLDSTLLKINKMKNDWLVGFSVGPLVYFGAEDHKGSFSKRIQPLYEITVGKWIYPYLGLRMSFGKADAVGYSTKRYEPIGEGYYTSNVPNKHGVYKQSWTFKLVHADLLLDLAGTKNFYKRRKYRCIAALGAGINWGDKEKHIGDPNRVATFYLGLQHAFILNKNLEIDVNTRYAITNHTFDRERTTGGFPGYANLTVGLTWNISAPERKSSNKWIYKTTTTTYRQIDNLNDSTKIYYPAKAKNKVYLSPLVIYFGVDSCKLTPESKLSLRFVAQQIKNSGAKIQLYASADSIVGNRLHDKELSEQRSSVVYDYLVNDCDVPKEQLQKIPLDDMNSDIPYHINSSVLLYIKDAQKTLDTINKIKGEHKTK